MCGDPPPRPGWRVSAGGRATPGGRADAPRRRARPAPRRSGPRSRLRAYALRSCPSLRSPRGAASQRHLWTDLSAADIPHREDPDLCVRTIGRLSGQSDRGLSAQPMTLTAYWLPHIHVVSLSSKAPKTPHALTSMRCPYLHERRSGCAVPCGGVVATAIVLGSHLHLLRSCARPPVARAVEGGELCWKGAVTCVERRGTRTSTMETMCRPPSLAMRIHTAHNSRERQQPHCSGSLVGQHKLFSGEHAIPVKVEHVEALLVLVERNVPVAI